MTCIALVVNQTLSKEIVAMCGEQPNTSLKTCTLKIKKKIRKKRSEEGGAKIGEKS